VRWLFIPLAKNLEFRLMRLHSRRRAVDSAVAFALETLETRQLLTSVLGTTFNYAQATQSLAVAFVSDMRGQIAAQDVIVDNVTYDSPVHLNGKPRSAPTVKKHARGAASAAQARSATWEADECERQHAYGNGVVLLHVIPPG